VIGFGSDEVILSSKDLCEMTAFGRLGFYLSVPVRLRRIIKCREITHTITFGDVTNIFSALTFTNEFKVASIHSLKSAELKSRTGLALVSELAYRRLYGAFNRVVCISKDIAEDLVRNCGFRFPDKLDVIYNPHDVDAIIQKGGELIPANEAYLFQRPVIIFIGRLSVEKAPGRLVQAFARLIRGGTNCNLVFVGDGSADIHEKIEALVTKEKIEDYVFFIGRQNNPYKYLARSSVLALTSRYEGTPNVIVEAIAHGVPVVSSYCTAGIAELMCRDGGLNISAQDSILEVDAGLITPHYSDHDDMEPQSLDEVFACALKMALEESKHRDRLNLARSSLLTKFDASKSVDLYLEAI
jgi:glycosyltransferase involved in cell wall biosynthesis